MSEHRFSAGDRVVCGGIGGTIERADHKWWRGAWLPAYRVIWDDGEDPAELVLDMHCEPGTPVMPPEAYFPSCEACGGMMKLYDVLDGRWRYECDCGHMLLVNIPKEADHAD